MKDKRAKSSAWRLARAVRRALHRLARQVRSPLIESELAPQGRAGEGWRGLFAPCPQQMTASRYAGPRGLYGIFAKVKSVTGS
jgi:hypothetical protein